VSILLANIVAEGNYGIGGVVGETCEHLLWKLEVGVFYTAGLTKVTFYWDPLNRRVTESFDRVVAASLYAHWFSMGHWVDRIII
jgi:hypothetical protein